MGTILKNGINYSGSSGGGSGVSSYNELTDKPSINGVTLSGNKTTSDLNIATSDTCYTTDDTAESTLADGDYFPFQDVSASGKRKTLWSNIKSVLKTYFDTLYNAKLTAGTNISISNNTISASMPVTGTFSKGHLYDTTEKVIGKWTDGRPLYQRTYTGTMPSSGADLQLFSVSGYQVKDIEGYTLYSGSGSPENMIMIPGLSVYSGKTTNDGFYTYQGYMWVYLTDANNYLYGRPYYITIRYTKSSDSASSYNYADENEYSTSEKIVGTWTNGAKLYQRTFTGTLASNLSTTVTTALSSYTIRDIAGIIRTGKQTITCNITLVSGSTTLYAAAFMDGSGNMLIYTNNTSLYGSTYELTIKYTK